MPGALEVIRRHLPEFFDEHHAAEFRDTMGALIPTTPEDIGVALATGPFGRAAKLGGLALAGMGYSPDVQAASGGLAKLAGLVSPGLGRIYDDSVAFGKRFPRASEDGPGDAARHAYAASRVAREYGPTTAQILGWLNEAAGIGSDRRAVRMDDFNNAAGLSMADLEDEAVRQRIADMIQSGQLKWMDGRSNLNAGY